MMKTKFIFCAGLLLGYGCSLPGQSLPGSDQRSLTTRDKNKTPIMKSPTTLFQYGVADAFINGLYEGQCSIGQVKETGNFGIGAPDLIDGELTMSDGKIYQTNAKGETFEAPDTLKSPLIFVSTFKAETALSLADITDMPMLFTGIAALLPDKNRIYAIRVTGDFSKMKTRAFSPVFKKPFKPLSQLLDQQHIFNFEHTNGSMIGFYMPGYLSGINIVGMHFHYLSADRKQGGHVLDVRSDHVKVEISAIDGFHLTVPATTDFKNYDFNKGNSHALNVVEKGTN
ncbi:acetolactate decarboxylase [Mucilaginibacter rubeus]|uniref:acetolactate decarboxylase n=1 Tax=Mucilaginibacter rubeus TaxID=2027860 RepID=UPI0033923590